MKKKKGFIVGFHIPGVYPPGRDDVQVDMLAPAFLKSVADADPQISQEYDLEVVNESIKTNQEVLAQKIGESRPDFVAYSTYIWNYDETIESSRRVRELSPNTKILFGGPQVSDLRRETMQEAFHLDVIISGTGEERFKEVLKTGFDRKRLSHMPLVAYRENGHPYDSPLIESNTDGIVLTGGHVEENVSNIPSPYKNGVINLDDGKKHTVFLETYRGCPYKCGYCIWGTPDGATSRFPLEQILGDIEVMFNHPNVEYVVFTDANPFYMPRKHWEPIFKKIASSSKKTPLVTNLDMRVMKPEMVEALSKVELAYNQYPFGMQTINPRALELADRGCKEDIRDLWTKGIKMIREMDPERKICLEVIYGLPGDNHEGFLNTVDFALGLGVNKVYMFPLLVLPGTPFWEKRGQFEFETSGRPDHMVKSNMTYSVGDMQKTFEFATWYQTVHRFPIIRNALVSSANETNGKVRRVDLVQQYIAQMQRSTGIRPEEEFGYSLPSANRILRTLMNQIIDPENGFRAYQIAANLVSPRNGKLKDLQLGLDYYSARKEKSVEDVDKSFVEKFGQDKLDQIKCNWIVYQNSIG